ncbi:YigZ family protein [Zobellella aerophila]|uniref:YigZ family protein n=1 Tax=Zobellella aerophila TaxID=870480 RepID=A0ABP6WFB8_9GAMM
MALSPYPVPAASLVWEQEIKKSRFIAHIAHTPTPADAKAFIESVRRTDQNAGHHCWAFVAGAPTDTQVLGFSDDGEPSGTAGKPMLAQLQGAGLGEVTAVVSRYFGGIKLGTGGLVRAYGGSVSAALRLLETRERRIMSRVALVADYGDITVLENLLAQYEGEWQQLDYGSRLSGVLLIDARITSTFCRQLSDRTQGRVQAKMLDSIL